MHKKNTGHAIVMWPGHYGLAMEHQKRTHNVQMDLVHAILSIYLFENLFL
jgi:hypothetical protein